MIRVAFFKAKYGGVDDKVIDFITGRQGYSHCELVIDRHTTVASHAMINGVKVFKYRDILNDPRWDVLSIPRDPVPAKRWALKQVGKQTYDFLGVAFTAITPFDIDRPDKIWCSELCAKALLKSDDSLPIDPLSMPNDLYMAMYSYSSLKNEVGVEPLKSSNSTLGLEELDIYGRIGYATKLQR